MSLMRCEGLGCRLSRHWVLRGIDLRVQAGERIALVGANGSGKTTLLRALHGLQALEEGRITWMAPTRQAMVFQRPHMMPARVRQQVSLSLWLAAKPLQRWPLGWATDAWAAWQAASEQTEGVLHQAHLHEQAHLPAQAGLVVIGGEGALVLGGLAAAIAGHQLAVAGPVRARPP